MSKPCIRAMSKWEKTKSRLQRLCAAPSSAPNLPLKILVILLGTRGPQPPERALRLNLSVSQGVSALDFTGKPKRTGPLPSSEPDN